MKQLGVFLLLCVVAANLAAHNDDHLRSHHHVDHPIRHPEQKKSKDCSCKCQGNGRGDDKSGEKDKDKSEEESKEKENGKDGNKETNKEEENGSDHEKGGIKVPDEEQGVGSSSKSKILKNMFNSKAAHSIVYNEKQQTFILVDFKSQYNVYYCGTGDVFIISSTSTTGAYLSKEHSNKTWDAKKESFEDFYKKIIEPKELYKIAQKTGIEFDSLTISEELENKLHSVVSTLSSEYEKNKCGIYGTVLQICKLSLPKKLEVSIFTDFDTDTSKDLQTILGMYKGVQDFSEAFGGYEAIKEKGVTFDTIKIAQSKLAADIIAVFFEKLSKLYDLGKVTEQFFKTESSWMSILSQLSGASYTGYSGYEKSISVIIKYISEEISEQSLTLVLTKYFTTKDEEEVDLEEVWNYGREKFRKIWKQYKLESKFKVVSKAMEMIKAKKWIIKGVNISEIGKIIIKYKSSKKTDKKSADEIVKKIIDQCNKRQ